MISRDAAPELMPATLARGARVGRYEIRALIGRGAMGEVYRARDPELQRKVAIKVVRASAAAGTSPAEAREGLLREARAMARIHHPNVVVVHDVGVHEDGIFVAMELVEGSTISCWMLSAPRTWREVLAVFVEAGRGLAAAHACDVVHHDFKPDNVMIGDDGHVRVMDFGLARELRGGTARATLESAARGVETTRRLAGAPTRPSSHAVGAWASDDAAPAADPGGTPAYMAAEQFLGEGTSARTDQFSFCVALWEALYDARPFAGANVTELRRNVMLGHLAAPPATSAVPARVRAALTRGLSPDPGRRWPSMVELLVELRRATAQEDRPSWRRLLESFL
jgi:serine/threonine protein kinase